MIVWPAGKKVTLSNYGMGWKMAEMGLCGSLQGRKTMHATNVRKHLWNLQIRYVGIQIDIGQNVTHKIHDDNWLING